MSEGNSIEWSSEFWMEVQSRVSAGVNEMREIASTIKTEMPAELNATRKRLHQMAHRTLSIATL